MQSYKRSGLMKALASKSGSVLVGAVAMCVIMAIGVAGLMGVVRGTVSQEAADFDENRALVSAESGLLMGVKWFKGASLDPDDMPDPVDVVINDMTVRIAISEADDDGNHTITSTALGTTPGANGRTFLAYDKELQLTVRRNVPPSGEWAYFIDRANDGNGFRRTSLFDGPVHFNTSLKLNNNDFPRFLGPVTVYNSGNYNYDYGVSTRSPHFNKYTSGLHIRNNSGGSEVTNLDRAFSQTYKDVPDSYKVDFNPEDSDSIKVFPLLQPDNIAGSYLKFGVYEQVGETPISCASCFTFYRQTTAGGFAPQPGDIPSDKKLIITADFQLTVRDGQMNGNVNVATLGNHDIRIDLHTGATNNGRLTYAGYTLPATLPIRGNSDATDTYARTHRPNNYNIQGYNLLAFYSGRNILINPVSFVSNTHYIITGQLLARNGTVTHPYTSNGTDGCINIFGAMIARDWWDVTQSNANLNAMRLFHDTRKMNAAGVTIEGMGTGGGGGGNLILSSWTETNR